MTIKEKIIKIISLALEINPPEIERIGKKRTAVFVEWSPHCNVLSGSIHYGGYRWGSSPDERIYVYCDKETSFKELDEIILKLESIKADLTVDNSEFNSDLEVVENSEPDSAIEPVEKSDVVENKIPLEPMEVAHIIVLLESENSSLNNHIELLKRPSFKNTSSIIPGYKKKNRC